MTSDAFAQAIRMRFYRRRVSKTLESGVLPLVLRYDAIYSCETRLPIAYRTQTVVRSTALGYLKPEDYESSCEGSDVAFRMAEWSVVQAMKHITKFVQSGRDLQWISVRVPSKMVDRIDFYKWMKKLVKENRFRYPTKLCLEFDVSLLNRQTERARLAVLDMKLLGVKTLLVGCADVDCPTSRLTQIPADMAMLAPAATKWVGSRNKPQLIPTLIPYLKSMRAEVYADGILNDEQIRLLNRLECVGYATASSYRGKYPTERDLGVRTALSQKDREDDPDI